MSDPNDQPRPVATDHDGDDDLVVDWDDFEAMGKRVLNLPPQSDDD